MISSPRRHAWKRAPTGCKTLLPPASPRLPWRRCPPQPFGAALSEAKKNVFGTRFDHAAVVIADRFGTPHVAEVTYRGIKLRRFDERILYSK